MFLFFFSSRSRHTRWPRDWSSDVCSSDLDGAVALDDASEEAARTDGRELVRVADEDRLAACLFDPLEKRGENAGLCHAGFVDDDGTAGREPARVASALEQPVERGRGDAHLILELL